jgi:hypothetical protein
MYNPLCRIICIRVKKTKKIIKNQIMTHFFKRIANLNSISLYLFEIYALSNLCTHCYILMT